MITRLKTWFGRPRQRKREQVAAEYGSLNKQEQLEVQRLREEHRGTFRDVSPDREFGNRPGT
jgi:hypothetical protein